MERLLNISNNTDWNISHNNNNIILKTKLNDEEQFKITLNNTDNIYDILIHLNKLYNNFDIKKEAQQMFKKAMEKDSFSYLDCLFRSTQIFQNMYSEYEILKIKLYSLIEYINIYLL